MSNGTTALAERKQGADVVGLAGTQIKTPSELAERIRAVQDQAFVLSPMAAVAAIAPGYVVNPVVVVIDPSVDAESGRGADVYYQPAIHKKHKQGDTWVPEEVSLNKNGLLKILVASGANVYPTQRLDDGTRAYYWSVMAQGDITDFDGRIRRLPPGSEEIDLRDGSPQVGGWTPEEWARNVREAEAKKAKLPENQQWKAKPEPIGGWTAERVMQARKFGLQLAESKALNRLARNLGIRQSYRIAELTAKPFVIFRASFVPDLTDPAVRMAVTQASLGARQLLYGSRPQEVATTGEPPLHHGEVGQVLDGQTVAGIEETLAKPLVTDAAPSDAAEVDFDEPSAAPAYHVKAIRQGGEWYYVETAEGPVLVTNDKAVAKGLNDLRKTGLAFEADTERVAIAGKSYAQVLETRAAGTLKL